MKYRYFRERVKTLEDFIRFAATKSIISGMPYMVRCGNKEVSSAEWLMEGLKRYRKAHVH